MPFTTKPKLLVIEDNALLHSQIHRSMNRLFSTEHVTTLQGAFSYLAENPASYDIVLVDCHLPDGSGLDVIPFVSQDAPETRICVLTQEKDEETRIAALRRGADAYLMKPLSLRCLQYHLQALLRREKKLIADCVHCQDLHFYTQKRVVERKNQAVRLSKRESQFLRIFLKTLDRHVDKQDLFQIFENSGHGTITKSAIHVTIQRLRKKLQPLQVTIDSVYGLGYQLRLTP
ncbi:response regulator transcription factor [Candidatus Woesebacteria bacterium]|nr:response regulator transcription factor [Candidatus Woesebacteria bacterium]MCD8507408.1 response regulator transcription factor [Candidatus Woesebacteria bacterium]MCD8527347.1 response regulator transcription factor [Candidatus Woesebacteria bacterium]MCD8546094.1 response regulator transcription factor [Candidatus Woesebacteria bacterium]